MARLRRKRQSAQIARRNRLRLDIWLMRHLQVALSSLGRLTRSPLSTLMTSAVIGIALALPAGLYLMLDNVERLSGDWDGAATISLFLQQNTSPESQEQLAVGLGLDPEISRVRSISRQQALEEFRLLSGFSDAIEALEENPLPPLLIVEPAQSSASPEAVQTLADRLGALPGVDFAQLDLQWVRRFHSITEIARRGVFILTSLLSLAVLLIIGNTIRLEIQNRHAEIEITKLIGGTDAFIRRPFLYNGAWYGLFGGLIAWLMILVSTWLLAGPVAQLAGLYESDFRLGGMGLAALLGLIGSSTLLGLAGSWIAVGRHLSGIEPG
jgi:cell division transport system permease protein